MLANQPLKAFIPTLNPVRAKRFYRDTLGLPLLSEDAYALEFNANGTILRVTTVETLNPHPFTVLGWNVSDLASIVESLVTNGVLLQKYEFLEQDLSGIWTSPGGTKVAWFKDPDGNLLSLS